MCAQEEVDVSQIKKARLERQRQVRHIVKRLPSKKALKSLGDPKKLPMLSLFAATSRYVLGAFEDCVLHSAFSVEMTLLLILDQEMTDKEKEDIKERSKRSGALSFGKVIQLSKEHHILNQDSMQRIWILYNLRNMFAHPGNWVAFVKHQYPETVIEMAPELILDLPSLIGGIEDIIKQKAIPLKRAAETGQKYLDERLGEIPDFEWAAHQGTLSFQQERAKSYYVRIIKDFLTRKTFKDFMKHLKDFPEYAQKRYRYPQETAYEALEIAFKILKRLEIL